ncbi:hypothetical protein [Nitrospira sp. Kam-Ns4a]
MKSLRSLFLTSGNRLGLVMSLAAGAAGGALSALLMLGPPAGAEDQQGRAAKVLAAEEFRLVDATGRVRALLAFSPSGEPYLALLDLRDTQRVWLGLAQDTGLAVRDRDGKTRLVLSLDQDGEPSLVVRDRERRSRSFRP